MKHKTKMNLYAVLWYIILFFIGGNLHGVDNRQLVISTYIYVGLILCANIIKE